MSGIDKEYDIISAQYDSITEMPLAQMEWQLTEAALGDCTGKTVLDLGGGTGLHARQAVDLGAVVVDNVDISPGMLEDGKSQGDKLGGSEPINWHVGDISKPLDNLPLKEAYDIILIGWTFDHAESEKQLEGMWQNASRYAKPGARLVNIRIANPHSPAGQSGKYGVQFTDFGDIPGGLSYKYAIATKPIFSCPATTMKSSMDFERAKKLAEQHGFVDYRQVPAHELKVVENDPEFWTLYLEEPFFVCVTATKKS